MHVYVADTFERWIFSTDPVAKQEPVASRLLQMQIATDVSGFVSLLWKLLT